MSHTKCSCPTPAVLDAAFPARGFCEVCGGARHEPAPKLVAVGHAEAVSPTARVKVSFHPTKGWTVEGVAHDLDYTNRAFVTIVTALAGARGQTNQHRRVALSAMDAAMGMAGVRLVAGFDYDGFRETQESA